MSRKAYSKFYSKLNYKAEETENLYLNLKKLLALNYVINFKKSSILKMSFPIFSLFILNL